MDYTNPNSNAFPPHPYGAPGMTKREYFAIEAYKSILILGNGIFETKPLEVQACEAADKLIAALNKQP